jgi:uncharacterized protein YkwD
LGCTDQGSSPVTPVNGTTEEEIISYTNLEREKKGLTKLSRNERLMTAAQDHAWRMAKENNLSHTLGGDPGRRLREAGYSWRTYGENIAYNYDDAESVVRGWMNSSGHRRNILNKDFKEIGVGCFYNGKGEPYYCQSFGSQ